MCRKTLILIPCCGNKRKGGVFQYDSSNGIINNLDLEAGRRLMKLRRQIAQAFKDSPGPDLGFENVTCKVRYLPAYKRYIGHLYSEISQNSWIKLNKTPELRLIIISALYGLVNYNEPIRYYQRKMKDHIYPGRLLKTWWKNHNLSSILLNYIIRNDIEVVHDFLSTDYFYVIRDLHLYLKKFEVQYIRHTYPGLGSGSDYYRGKHVNTLIQSFDTDV